MDISNVTFDVLVYEYFFNFTDEELYNFNLTSSEFQNFHPNITNIGKSDYLL